MSTNPNSVDTAPSIDMTTALVVYNDNLLAAGTRRGADPLVAKDLGYVTHPSQLQDILSNAYVVRALNQGGERSQPSLEVSQDVFPTGEKTVETSYLPGNRARLFIGGLSKVVHYGEDGAGLDLQKERDALLRRFHDQI